MATAPRVRRASVRDVVDSVADDPGVAQETHDGIWASVWARKYSEVNVPVWAPEVAYEGVVIFSRAFASGQHVTVVDTDETALLATGRGNAIPVGSTVLLVGGQSGQFEFTGIKSPGLGIELRFDDNDRTLGDYTWVDTLRHALHKVREAQNHRRTSLERWRRSLGSIMPPMPLEQIWKKKLEAIRAKLEEDVLYTPAELAQLEKARAKRNEPSQRAQKQGMELERKIVSARQERFRARAAYEVDALKKAWPTIASEREQAVKIYVDYKLKIQQIESALSESRAVTDLSWTATKQLDDIERAGLRVRAFELPDGAWDDFGLGRELARSVDILHRAIASRTHGIVKELSRTQPPAPRRAV